MHLAHAGDHERHDQERDRRDAHDEEERRLEEDEDGGVHDDAGVREHGEEDAPVHEEEGREVEHHDRGAGDAEGHVAVRRAVGVRVRDRDVDDLDLEGRVQEEEEIVPAAAVVGVHADRRGHRRQPNDHAARERLRVVDVVGVVVHHGEREEERRVQKGGQQAARSAHAARRAREETAAFRRAVCRLGECTRHRGARGGAFGDVIVSLAESERHAKEGKRTTSVEGGGQVPARCGVWFVD